MHYRFERDGGATLTVDVDVWLCALDLAVAHGWKPLGIAHSEGKRSFEYSKARGQRVDPQDADALARSLEVGLRRVPNRVVQLRGAPFGEDNTRELIEHAAKGHPINPEEARAAVELLSGPPRAEAQELASFLHEGGFRIHPRP